MHPEGCPGCGRPNRFICFTHLSRGDHWYYRTTTTRTKQKALFAECLACHEAWVWYEDMGNWQSVRDVQKVRKARSTIRTKPARPVEETDRDRIGKIY